MLPVADFERNVPQLLKEKRRWLAWGPDPERPAVTKVPLLISNKKARASTRKESTWSEWASARAFYNKYSPEGVYGVGYVFAEGDGLVYVDIDDALDEAGSVREWAAPFVLPFAGRAYIETSPSGRGLHVICRGRLPEGVGDVGGGVAKFPNHRSPWAESKNKTPEVAVFISGKYTTLTGQVRKDNRHLSEDCSDAVAQVWKEAGIQAHAGTAKSGPCPDPDTLPEVDGRRVPRGVRQELEDCKVVEAEDRSSARYQLYVEAAQALDPEETLRLILDSEWYTLSGAEEKGLGHTWTDICRAYAKAETAKKAFDEVVEQQKTDEKVAASGWKELDLAMRVETVGKEAHWVPVYGVQNLVRVLTRHPKWKGRVRLNQFKERIEVDGVPLGESVSHIAEDLRAYLKWDSEPPAHMVKQAVLEAAEAAAYHPVTDYLKSLTWDGKLRINDWLVRAGCEDCALTRVIGRKWLLSLVARGLKPGVKCDTMLILEGEQGFKKSTFFAALAGPEAFTDTKLSLDRDGMMVVHGHWVVEVAELASFKKADQESVKNFLSRSTDTFRPPYGRVTVTRARHFVVVGSTNDSTYLNDPTGARRYWPVSVPKTALLDVELVRREREQLLAEAVAALNLGAAAPERPHRVEGAGIGEVFCAEPYWFDTQPEALLDAQEDRFQQDPLEERVRDYLKDPMVQEASEHRISDILTWMGLQPDRQDLTNRIGTVLRRLGLVERRRRLPGVKHPARVWFDPVLFEDPTRPEARVLNLRPAVENSKKEGSGGAG